MSQYGCVCCVFVTQVYIYTLFVSCSVRRITTTAKTESDFWVIQSTEIFSKRRKIFTFWTEPKWVHDTRKYYLRAARYHLTLVGSVPTLMLTLSPPIVLFRIVLYLYGCGKCASANPTLTKMMRPTYPRRSSSTTSQIQRARDRSMTAAQP